MNFLGSLEGFLRESLEECLEKSLKELKKIYNFWWEEFLNVIMQKHWRNKKNWRNWRTFCRYSTNFFKISLKMLEYFAWISEGMLGRNVKQSLKPGLNKSKAIPEAIRGGTMGETCWRNWRRKSWEFSRGIRKWMLKKIPDWA